MGLLSKKDYGSKNFETGARGTRQNGTNTKIVEISPIGGKEKGCE